MTTKDGIDKVIKLRDDGWTYCGGTKDIADVNTWNKFKMMNTLEDYSSPKRKKKCQCGHPIMHQCYIYKIDNDGNFRFRVIGIECIKKFYNEKYKELRKTHNKICPICYNIHGNRKRTELCPKCCEERCEKCYKYGVCEYKYCYNCK